MKLMRILPMLMMIIQLTESGPGIRHRRSVFDVIPTVENHHHHYVRREHPSWRSYKHSGSGNLHPIRLEAKAVQKRKDILKKLFC